MQLILLNACRLIKELEALFLAQNDEMQSINKWEPTQGDSLKANFDEATSESKRTSTMGIVIRNVKGDLITTSIGQRILCSPLQTKCETALLALQTTQALGISRLALERDSIEVIKSL